MDELLPFVKDALNKNYLDEAGENRLLRYIEMSAKRLNDVAGTELNFLENELARELLVNRVNYAMCNALDEFDTNYRSELIQLHLRGMIDDAEEE